MTSPSYCPSADQLPESWEVVQLAEVANINPPGGALLAADSELVSFVPMPAVSERSGKIVTTTVRPFGEVKKGYTRFLEEDVLFAKITPCMENGKIAVARGLTNGKGCGSTEFHVLRPEQGILSDWLRYYLVQDVFRREAQRHMSGAVGQLRVPPDYLRLAQMPLPTSAEQVRIVSRIEELFSDLDEGEECLRRAQAQLKRYRQSVLKAAVTGELTRTWREQNADKLESGEALLTRILKARREAWEKTELEKLRAKGKPTKDNAWKARYVEPQGPNTDGLPELPQGWVWASIGQLFNVFIGSTPARKEPFYWGGGIPWVSSGEVAFCRVKTTRETVSELGYQNSSIKLHPKGTVLIAMIGEGKTRGQVAILDIPACHSQNSAAIRVSETPIPPEYIYHFLASRYDLNRKRGQGGNQPALNKELVQGIPVPLPPLLELSELIDDVERRLAIADVMEVELNNAAASTRALRQSILKAAFTGKLVPQDPNDEPAEELLKRISAERAAQGASPARRAASRAPRKARAAASKSASAPAAPPVAATGLAAARKAAGLSQAQLAERAGINQAYVSQMETGKRAITADQAAALARALGIEPSVLTQA